MSSESDRRRRGHSTRQHAETITDGTPPSDAALLARLKDVLGPADAARAPTPSNIVMRTIQWRQPGRPKTALLTVRPSVPLPPAEHFRALASYVAMRHSTYDEWAIAISPSFYLHPSFGRHAAAILDQGNILGSSTILWLQGGLPDEGRPSLRAALTKLQNFGVGLALERNSSNRFVPEWLDPALVRLRIESGVAPIRQVASETPGLTVLRVARPASMGLSMAPSMYDGLVEL